LLNKRFIFLKVNIPATIAIIRYAAIIAICTLPGIFSIRGIIKKAVAITNEVDIQAMKKDMNMNPGGTFIFSLDDLELSSLLLFIFVDYISYIQLCQCSRMVKRWVDAANFSLLITLLHGVETRLLQEGTR
jgi:hypothetical protein